MRSAAIAVSMLAGLCVAAPAVAQPLTIDLTCPVRGTGKEMVKNYQTRVDGVARVKIRGDVAEIMLPPGISVLGDWFKVKKLAISDSEIRGSVQTALLSSSKLVIDRIGGSISLSGDNGSFGGRCSAADPGQRAF